MQKLFRTMACTALVGTIALASSGCGGDATSPKIRLSDAPAILDLSTELGTGFERLDAAAEGMSNRDMQLGSDFSEVQVFLSAEPYQMVFTYMAVVERRSDQVAQDAFMRDEKQIRQLVVENLQQGASEEGVDVSDAKVEITYPTLGDQAVLGTGSFTASSVGIGFDLLMFRSQTVLVFVASVYLPGENKGLLPVGTGIEQRIKSFGQ